MSNYKYRICENKKFWFELLPNNNNTQPVASSSIYDTYDEAVSGLDHFKKYMARNENNLLDCENLFVKGNLYQYRIFFTDSHREYITARSCEKFNLKYTEQRIRKNYLVSLRRDL